MITLFTRLCCTALLCITMASEAAAKPRDCVVLLHGIMRSSASMDGLAELFAHQGYDVVNIDYPSTQHRIEVLVDDVVSPAIDRGCGRSRDRLTHLVGYSMGGLLIRDYIDRFYPQGLGRVVMIATPNQGSEVADVLKANSLYQQFYGPAGQQLITMADAPSPVSYELGIIAGNHSMDWVSSAIIPGDDDGKVAVERTKLNGMKDHIILQASHLLILDNVDAQQQALYFIRHGRFAR